jgi:mRNA interferase HigB
MQSPNLPLDAIFAKREDRPMRIVSRKAIREATVAHSECGASLNAWYQAARNADWKNFAEVRNTWKNSDIVGPFVVFDISHNRCRLIATIKYKWGMLYIRRILSPAEYDEQEWQK